MTLSTTTLRPGFLVSLRTMVTGNVKYDKQVIESEHIVDGEQKARWETERTIYDPVEHEASIQAQGKARSVIAAVCAKSTYHGLLCAKDKADQLEAAIKEARRVANEFNDSARRSRLSVNVMVGEIAQSDEEAVRAINAEIRWLLSAMEQGVKELDVKVIREAANKAKALGSMLTDSAKENVQAAIAAARLAARQIVKAGEQAAQEVDTATMRKIANQRTMFLDLDDVEAAMVAPKAEARAIEMTTETTTEETPVAPPVTPRVARVPRLQLELD
jgi:hypothetical protein